jgi:hypothetical protein
MPMTVLTLLPKAGEGIRQSADCGSLGADAKAAGEEECNFGAPVGKTKYKKEERPVATKLSRAQSEELVPKSVFHASPSRIEHE